MIHDRELVKKLQNAHADWIESVYRQKSLLSGNPDGIEIEHVGNTRVFLSNKNRLENRAIFTGNESEKEFQTVTALFEEKGIDCFVEVNPANFYRTEPFTWKSEVLPHLLQLGYRPEGFRCVWLLTRLRDLIEFSSERVRIRRFTHDEADEYAAAKLQVEPVPEDNRAYEAGLLSHGFTKDWINYIGYAKNEAVSTSQLFIKNQVGYLAWGYTMKSQRGKGHHKLHVCKRVRDAFSRGSSTVFSVTDFDIPSARNLQKCGFRLAYNYMLLKRSPTRG
jgi:hypothetical protein